MSEDLEALDGGTSQLSSQRKYGEIKMFCGFSRFCCIRFDMSRTLCTQANMHQQNIIYITLHCYTMGVKTHGFVDHVILSQRFVDP